MLSHLESSVLAYLARNRRRPVPPTELLAAVWGTPLHAGGTVDQVKSCIKRLRAKVESGPTQRRVILTVRSRGYVLAGDSPNGPAHS